MLELRPQQEPNSGLAKETQNNLTKTEDKKEQDPNYIEESKNEIVTKKQHESRE